MVDYITPPDPRVLLPPLLACLPAAFASPKPPPALLPLLSPILRQRIQFLTSVSSPSSDTWLRLLCWDATRAARVETIVGDTTFEPHPVSGEIDIPDEVPVTYKRFDSETLRCCLSVEEYGMTVLYVWCPSDQEGGGPGWRVTELIPLESSLNANEDDLWFASVGEANEHGQESVVTEAIREAELRDGYGVTKNAPNKNGGFSDGDDDDGSYWAQYDDTPARTPAPEPFPGVQNNKMADLAQSTAEDSYFGRYAEVQPAMDNDDPSVDREQVGGSSVDGDVVNKLLRRHAQTIGEHQQPSDLGRTTDPVNGTVGPPYDSSVPLSHPRPSSASSGSEAISKLEQTAESQSASEVGVKQHISSNIKSLFRLAKSSGISKAEFESIVKRELDTLDLLDMEDH